MMTTAASATMAATTTTAATATVVTAVTIQQAVNLGIFATALLIGLLIVKELLAAYAAEPQRARSWKAKAAGFYAAHLNVAIVPLLFVFALIVATKVSALL